MGNAFNSFFTSLKYQFTSASIASFIDVQIKAKQGDDKAILYMMYRTQKQIIASFYKYFSGKATTDDAAQSEFISNLFLKLKKQCAKGTGPICKFDINKMPSCTTDDLMYNAFGYYMYRYCGTMITNINRKKKKTIDEVFASSLSYSDGSEEDNVFENIGDTRTDNKYLKEDINSLLKELPNRSMMILTMHYGLNGEKAITLEEIGQKLHLTKERIRQIESKALKQLKTIAEDRQIDNSFAYLNA